MAKTTDDGMRDVRITEPTIAFLDGGKTGLKPDDVIHIDRIQARQLVNAQKGEYVGAEPDAEGEGLTTDSAGALVDGGRQQAPVRQGGRIKKAAPRPAATAEAQTTEPKPKTAAKGKK